MTASPFKFLDSYTKEDKDIFFGRNQEIEQLYQKVFESKLLLAYGVSGTGKSSLIQCGLANKFNDSDWLPINIRRGSNINDSLNKQITQNLLTEVKETASLKKKINSLYLDHFKPIYLIFDQFEELFIFGSDAEKDEFIQTVKKLVESDIQCKLIFAIREEYLANITEFEREIPSFLENRIRIEKMRPTQAKDCVEGPCRYANISLEDGVSQELLKRLTNDKNEIELTWLQVFLDKLYRTTTTEPKQFTHTLLQQMGKVSDLLGSFLDEQITQSTKPDETLAILKSFVSIKGTKRQISLKEVQSYCQTIGKQINENDLKIELQHLVTLRILRDKDEYGRYELRHDALAAKIYEKITLVEKELMEVRQFIENAYANYLKRKVLLSKEDLGYLAPYEDKLYLPKKEKAFVTQCKNYYEKIKRRKRRIVTTSISIFAVISVIFGINTYKAQKVAELQAKILKSKSLGNKAWQYVESNPTLAFLIAEEAWNIYPTLEAERGILNAYYKAHDEGAFCKTIKGNKIKISPSKKQFLIRNSEDSILRLYDNAGDLKTEFKGHKGIIMMNGFNFSENGKYVISESLEDSSTRVWNLEGKEIITFNSKEANMSTLILDTLIYNILGSKITINNYSGDLLNSLNVQDSIISFKWYKPFLIIETKGYSYSVIDLSKMRTLIKRKFLFSSKIKFDYIRNENTLFLKDKNYIVLWNWKINKVFKYAIQKEIKWYSCKIIGENLLITSIDKTSNVKYIIINSEGQLIKNITGKKYSTFNWVTKDKLNKSIEVLSKDYFHALDLGVVFNKNGQIILRNVKSVYFDNQNKEIHTANYTKYNIYSFNLDKKESFSLDKYSLSDQLKIIPINKNVIALITKSDVLIIDKVGHKIASLPNVITNTFNNEEIFIYNKYVRFVPKTNQFQFYNLNNLIKQDLIQKINSFIVKDDCIIALSTKNIMVFDFNYTLLAKISISSDFNFYDLFCFEIDKDKDLIGINYILQNKESDSIKYILNIINTQNNSIVYEDDNNVKAFKFINNDSINFIYLTDSTIKYVNYSNVLFNSWNIDDVYNFPYEPYYPINYSSLIAIKSLNHKLSSYNFISKTKKEYDIEYHWYSSMDLLRSPIIFSPNNDKFIYYYFKSKEFNIYDDQGKILSKGKLPLDIFSSSAFKFIGNNKFGYVKISIEEFSKDPYRIETRFKASIPSYFLIYNYNNHVIDRILEFNNKYSELLYLNLYKERIAMGSFHSNFLLSDLNNQEILKWDKADNMEICCSPNGKFLIKIDNGVLSILSMDVDEIINKVRNKDELGKLPYLQEQEKKQFGIIN